jgi:putative transposase
MTRKRYSETEIIEILKEVEAGATVSEVIRRYGIAEATFYRWKLRYGKRTQADERRLREIDEENSKLKHLLAEATLEIHALREQLTRKH